MEVFHATSIDFERPMMASLIDACSSTDEPYYLSIQEGHLKSKEIVMYSGTLPQKTASANEKDISFPVHMDQIVPESSSSETNCKLFPESPDSDCRTISSEDEEPLSPVSMDQMVPESCISNVPGTKPFPGSPDSLIFRKTTSRSDSDEHSDDANQDPMVSENSSNAPQNKTFVDESEPMSEPMRKAVYAQRPQLLKVPFENIKAELHMDAEGFLNDAEEEEIDACPTNKGKMNLALKILRTKNVKAFISFCGALVSSGYGHFALKLSEQANVDIEAKMAKQKMSTGKVLSKKKSAYNWEPVLTSLRQPYNDVWHLFEEFVLGASDDIFRAVRGDYRTSLAVKQKVSCFSDLVPMQRMAFLEHARRNTTFFDIRLVCEIAFSKHCNSSALAEAVKKYEANLQPLMTTAIHKLTDRCDLKPISENSREGTYKLVLKFPDDANVQDLYDAKSYLETRLGIKEAKLLAFDFGCILIYFEVSCSPDQLEALRGRFTAHSEQWEDLGISGAYLVNHWAWEAKETPVFCALPQKRSPSQTGRPLCKFSESQSTDTHSMQMGHMEGAAQIQSDHSHRKTMPLWDFVQKRNPSPKKSHVSRCFGNPFLSSWAPLFTLDDMEYVHRSRSDGTQELGDVIADLEKHAAELEKTLSYQWISSLKKSHVQELRDAIADFEKHVAELEKTMPKNYGMLSLWLLFGLRDMEYLDRSRRNSTQELRGAIADLEEHVAELEELLDKISDLKKRVAELKELRNVIADLKKHVAKLKETLSYQWISSLGKSHVQELLDKIADMKKRVAELKELRDENADLKKREVELKELRDEIADLKKCEPELKKLRDTNAFLKRRVAKLKELRDENTYLEKRVAKFEELRNEIADLKKRVAKWKEPRAHLEKIKAKLKLELQTRRDPRNQEFKRPYSESWQHPHEYAPGTPPHHGYAYVRHKASDEMTRSSSDSSLGRRTVVNLHHGIYIENRACHPLPTPFCDLVLDPIPSHVQVKFHQASSRGVLEPNDDESLPLSEYYEKQLHDCEEFLSSVEERGKHDAALEELIAHVKKKISSLRTELEKSVAKLQDVLDPHHGTRSSRHH